MDIDKRGCQELGVVEGLNTVIRVHYVRANNLFSIQGKKQQNKELMKSLPMTQSAEPPHYDCFQSSTDSALSGFQAPCKVSEHGSPLVPHKSAVTVITTVITGDIIYGLSNVNAEFLKELQNNYSLF